MLQQSDRRPALKPQSQCEQELVVAARKGDVAKVQQLIESGVSVNAVDEFGMTPLMLLAAQGLKSGVKLLLDHPACLVNKRTSSMLVALHFAAEKGHADCVELLLQHGAVVNMSDDWGETPLIKAAGGTCIDETGRVAVVSLLLNNGARTHMIDLHGRDALVHAARSGLTETVRVLLDHGADPNHGARALALHEAASFGHVGCVEALLEAGARPNMRNLHGHLPLDLATHMDHAPVVECLLKRSGWSIEARDSALVMAVTSNSLSSLSILLQHGANPDAVDFSGVPVLHLAIEMNHTEAVRILIHHNVNVNRRLYHTYTFHNQEVRDVCAMLAVDFVTPLMLAVIRGRTSLIRMLVKVGASLGDVSRIIRNVNVLRRLPSLTSDADMMRWLHDRCTTPPSLQLVASIAVRSCFDSQHIGKIFDLPLPRTLLESIALMDLDLG